jgi:hypothetical protein
MKFLSCVAVAAAAAFTVPSAADARGAQGGWTMAHATPSSAAPARGGFSRGPGRHFAGPCVPGGPRPCRRPRHGGGDSYGLAWGGGYGDPEARPAPVGYFGGGGEVRVANGRAVYDYDRGYPYEFASRGTAAPALAALAEPAYRCSVAWLRGGEGVRVCRR